MRACILLLFLPAVVSAQASPATRGVRLDSSGVVRWADNGEEVALFGANYVVHTASDYRAAGYLHLDRRKMIDEDMAHFARMGWDGLRLTFWGDWESADSAGNLIANDHLDLLDYLIAKARERGIAMLFSPIQLYGSNWPDALGDTTQPGFGRVFGKARMGTDPAAIAAQVNYLRQILEHVNPYTGVKLKDEPAIIMIELVNEPWHHPEDMDGSVRYINALVDAVRSTGCDKLIFYNVSQDFRIGEAIRRSRAQGVTFGWYPTGLNSGHELPGNHLRSVDVFPDMLRPELARLPRIVYEFDSPDLRNATMYPAMARTMRSVGAQMALMFAYDMLGTASRNLGWQTHYLSLAYTPRKAMASIIAAEAMRRLPRMRAYGAYPSNLRFGDFRLAPDSNLAELVANNVYMNAGATTTPPRQGGQYLERVAGYQSSPIVRYDGEGVYFLDKVEPGVWRLEVYPDAVPVRDPFEPMSPDRIVTRAISRERPMTVTLADLGARFSVEAITDRGAPRQAVNRGFQVRPGVYLLRSNTPGNLRPPPARIRNLAFDEFHAPPADTMPTVVRARAVTTALSGRSAEIRVDVVQDVAPDSVVLFVRPLPGGWFRGIRMQPSGAYGYAATVPTAELGGAPNEYVVTVYGPGGGVTYPGAQRGRPWDWTYASAGAWRIDLVAPGTPLRLFDPAMDAASLHFTRIGDAGRRGLFRVGFSPATGAQVFHFELPVNNGWSPEDYTASLMIGDRVGARQETIAAARDLVVRLRGTGPRQTVHLTLMEEDGTSWTAPVIVDSAWSEQVVAIASLRAGRGVMLPQGFPGEWNYWVGPAEARGTASDRPRLSRVERLLISLRKEDGVTVLPGSYGVEIESITMRFGGP